ncbi:MAG: hypothetical protein M5U26_11025 [Planctomycetota bacterium]|nr:hypothetical protein [Planctomycetota bacterium]
MEAYARLRAEGAKALPAILAHLKADELEVRTQSQRLLAELWRDRAAEEYLKAYRLAVAGDISLKEMPLAGVQALASYEAGRRYIEILAARGIRKDERAEVDAIKANLEKMENLPEGAVTPIVFPLDRARALSSLLAPDERVAFDLDGDLRAEERSWVGPETGILVWDPLARGEIVSGRQLFGSVTWWIFWKDGYQALDALDDDRNGLLEGAEMDGLAVWVDADQDAVSEPGEVRPLSAHGIVGLSVNATRTEDGCPANPKGLHLSDGRALPTYDWIAK